MQDVYNPCKRVFCVLPLAAVVQQKTLVLHGGLFRSQPRSAKVPKNKRKRGNPVLLGASGSIAKPHVVLAMFRGNTAALPG